MNRKNLTNLIENEGGANLGSVNGMGDVSLPSGDNVGSGDIPGGTGSTAYTQVSEPIEMSETNKAKMKKFDDIHPILEQEIYVNIKELGDPAQLIDVLSNSLKTLYNEKKELISQKLTEIDISYNGTVDIKSVKGLSKLLKVKPKELVEVLDSLILENIQLLEQIQMEEITKLLNGTLSLNESLLGRAIGAVGGYFIGPKVGKIIAKVLGITKGPFYNVLTSKIVGAALAQELTKNLV